MTRLVDDACIFLNRPGSPQGAGCALHVAALEAGERPLDWKPNVCWQVPLRLEHSTDENGHVTSRLRDWKRRDWGDGGHRVPLVVHRGARGFSGDKPVYVSVRDEIIELIGAPIYDLLVASLEGKRPPALPTPVGLRRRRHSSSSASSSNSTP